MAFRESAFRALFKLYYRVHDRLENRFYVNMSRFLRLPHPKNLYDFRSREFLSRISPDDRVADLGCGTGKIANQIAALGNYVVGVDLKKPMLSEGRFEFIQKDILDPEVAGMLAERKITTLVLSHVIEHIEDVVGFLKRWNKMGKVLVCVPSQENWRYQFKKSLGLDPTLDRTHFREYSFSMLKEHAASAGFKVKELCYTSEGEIFATLVGSGD